MMRDVWGRPIGFRSPSPGEARRAPVRPFAQPRVEPLRAREPVDEISFREEEPSHGRPLPIPEPVPRVPGAAPAPALAPEQVVDDPRAQLAAAQAELEASRARLGREASREREADKLRLVSEVLPVLDDLDRSIAAAHADASVKPALVNGFDLVRARLERVLHQYGLERIPALGEPFDPAVHDAVALVHVDDESKRGVVVDELARGYRAGGRVLRAAMVRVGAAA